MHNFYVGKEIFFPWAGKNESGVSPKNKGGVPILLGAPPLSVFFKHPYGCKFPFYFTLNFSVLPFTLMI